MKTLYKQNLLADNIYYYLYLQTLLGSSASSAIIAIQNCTLAYLIAQFPTYAVKKTAVHVQCFQIASKQVNKWKSSCRFDKNYFDY